MSVIGACNFHKYSSGSVTYQCLWAQFSRSDKDWHRFHRASSQTRTDTLLCASAHSCVRPATARYVRKPREETPYELLPATWICMMPLFITHEWMSERLSEQILSGTSVVSTVRLYSAIHVGIRWKIRDMMQTKNRLIDWLIDWAVFYVPSNTVYVIRETVFIGQMTQPTVSKYWRKLHRKTKTTQRT